MVVCLMRSGAGGRSSPGRTGPLWRIREWSGGHGTEVLWHPGALCAPGPGLFRTATGPRSQPPQGR